MIKHSKIHEVTLIILIMGKFNNLHLVTDTIEISCVQTELPFFVMALEVGGYSSF